MREEFGTDERLFSPTKLTRQTLNEQVYEGLKEAIISGSLVPGKVLTIREVAELFGVSMMPVREALSRLVSERALNLKPNRSVTVPLVTVDHFRQITQIRSALEGMAARAGAECATPTDIQELEMLNDQLEASARLNPTAFLNLNRLFHFKLYALSKQDYLIKMITSLWLQTGPLLNFLLSGRNGQVASEQVRHRDLLAAIHRRDFAAAETAIQADINDAAAFILPLLERSLAAARSGS
jgi:DNA-binding GntR family transcriptional regulator